jgi:hypothetical protein
VTVVATAKVLPASLRQIEREENYFFRPGVFVSMKFACGDPHDRSGANGPLLRSGRNPSFPLKDVEEVSIRISMGSEPPPRGDTSQHGFGGAVQ